MPATNKKQKLSTVATNAMEADCAVLQATQLASKALKEQSAMLGEANRKQDEQNIIQQRVLDGKKRALTEISLKHDEVNEKLLAATEQKRNARLIEVTYEPGEETGNMDEMGPLVYVEGDDKYNAAVKKNKAAKDALTRVLQHGTKQPGPTMVRMDTSNQGAAVSQTYDNGIYMAVIMSKFLAAMWRMKKAAAIAFLEGQHFQGAAIDIFNKILIIKIGAGRCGNALEHGALMDTLGGYGTTHREKSLTEALGAVYKKSIGDTDDEEKPTWSEPDDKRLWNIGPKNGCMMMSSVMVGKEITTARGGQVFLGSEKGAKGQTLEVLARTGVIKSTGLPSLNGCNPVYLQLPLGETVIRFIQLGET
jgi:hypothetical protein